MRRLFCSLLIFLISTVASAQTPVIHLSFDEPWEELATVKGSPEFSKSFDGLALNLSASAASRKSLVLKKNDHLKLGGSHDFTILIWLKMNPGTIDDNVIITNKRSENDTSKGWSISSRPNGSWRWTIGNGKSGLDYWPTPQRQPVNDGFWHQIAFSFDSQKEETRLYHDDLNVAVYNCKGFSNLAFTSSVTVGSSGSNKREEWDTFNGCIDDLKIWNRVLTSQKIRENYYRFFPKKHSIPSKKITEFRILAFNIWHGGHEHGEVVGVNRVIDVIRDSKADIVAMVETYGSGAIIADALNYYLYLRSSNLSIMSRFPIGETFEIFQPFNSGGSILQLNVTQQLAFFPIWLYHLPSINIKKPGVSADSLIIADNKTRGSQIQAILQDSQKQLSKAGDIPVIFAGDFNSFSHLDWTEKTKHYHNDLVVSWPVTTYLEQAGFKDAYRNIFPDPLKNPGNTWSPIFKKSLQGRIDYIFFKGEKLQVLETKVIDFHKVKWPSDHAAVLAAFRLEN